jgi:hypothetical protein
MNKMHCTRSAAGVTAGKFCSATHGYFRELWIEVNFVFNWVPRPFTAAMIAR